MKKVLFTLISFFLIIGIANASVASETLQDACEIEGLDCVSKKEYDESLPNAYLFRGDGCPYCNELIKYIDSIIDNYKVNVIVYEVKDNKDNWNFYKKVGKEFDFTPSGYPYLVIGETTFDGYLASSDDEDIKKALDELQNAENPYDVVYELENKPEDNESNDKAVIVIIVCAAIVMGAYLAYNMKNKN